MPYCDRSMNSMMISVFWVIALPRLRKWGKELPRSELPVRSELLYWKRATPKGPGSIGSRIFGFRWIQTDN
eukprot:1521687-Rhodomonas_salina.1